MNELETNRGNFWEVTYKPQGWQPHKYDVTQESPLSNQTGLKNTRLVASPHNKCAKSLYRDKDRYEKCDFSFDLENGSFVDCSFESCRFYKMTWRNVKFNKCKFEKCDFTFATFEGCSFFENCSFQCISVSAEHLKMSETSISASRFLCAINTNLNFLPDAVCPKYQSHRLIASKAKIARTIFLSTNEQADLGIYFQANKELVLSTLRERIESWRYHDKLQRNSFCFCILSSTAWLEYWLASISGWLTDWGQSVVRALVFFLALVGAFATCYYFSEEPTSRSILKAFFKSYDISVVAGYTSHRQPNGSTTNESIKAINILLGIYWYSLIIPTIVRRVLR